MNEQIDLQTWPDETSTLKRTVGSSKREYDVRKFLSPNVSANFTQGTRGTAISRTDDLTAWKSTARKKQVFRKRFRSSFEWEARDEIRRLCKDYAWIIEEDGMFWSVNFNEQPIRHHISGASLISLGWTERNWVTILAELMQVIEFNTTYGCHE